MKITAAKRRLLKALYDNHNRSQQEIDRATFTVDPNTTCYVSLQTYGLVAPPGRLTEAGLSLATELFADPEVEISKEPMW